MGFLRRYWKPIAGAVCGAAATSVAAFVSPPVGILLGAACTAAFGQHAAALGEELTRRVLEVLHPGDAQKLADALKPPAKKGP